MYLLYMEIFIIIVCVILSIQDIEEQMIYSPLNSLLLILGLINSNHSIISKICGIVAIPTILFLINKYIKVIIGEGDIEFISAAGLILGFYSQSIMLFISSLLAGIYMLITKKKSIPMIPFLSIGLFLCLLL